MTKLNNLSTNVVEVMLALAENQGLARLLCYNQDNPFDESLPDINNMSELINPKDPEVEAKILPYPFDPEATVDDSSFIRIYYNQGEFDNSEVIQEMQLNIDIVVAKSLWLINDGRRSLIRPYEIMDRVVDIVGRRSYNPNIKVNFTGWQHLAVNTKFDAIRLYSDYWNVEADNHYGM